MNLVDITIMTMMSDYWTRVLTRYENSRNFNDHFFNTDEVIEETKNIACRNRWFWHVQGWRKKSSIDPRLGPKSGQHANITLCKSSGTWETYPAAPLLSKYVCSVVLNYSRRLEKFTRLF